MAAQTKKSKVRSKTKRVPQLRETKREREHREALERRQYAVMSALLDLFLLRSVILKGESRSLEWGAFLEVFPGDVARYSPDDIATMAIFFAKRARKLLQLGESAYTQLSPKPIPDSEREMVHLLLLHIIYRAVGKGTGNMKPYIPAFGQPDMLIVQLQEFGDAIQVSPKELWATLASMVELSYSAHLNRVTYALNLPSRRFRGKLQF